MIIISVYDNDTIFKLSIKNHLVSRLFFIDLRLDSYLIKQKFNATFKITINISMH